MSTVINIITTSADLDTIFENRVNAALADGWEILSCTVVQGNTTRLFAVMTRENEEARVPGKAPGKGKGKAKSEGDNQPPTAEEAAPTMGDAVTMVPGTDE